MKITSLRRSAAPLAVAAAAVFAWSPPPSLAATSASASLTNFTWTAFDTDLTDGIEAGFHFLPGQSSGGFFFDAQNSVPQTDRDSGGLSGQDSPFIAFSGSASVAGAQASGASTGDSLTVSGVTSAAGTRFDGIITGNAGALFIKANTLLRVEVDYSALAMRSDTCDAIGCEGSFARAFFNLNSGEQPDDTLAEACVRLNVAGDGFCPSESSSGTFVFEKAFPSDTSATFVFGVQVFGIQPIPEPESYALMLLGLGALGIVSRRRARH